jgi:hypothetical protein
VVEDLPQAATTVAPMMIAIQNVEDVRMPAR